MIILTWTLNLKIETWFPGSFCSPMLLQEIYHVLQLSSSSFYFMWEHIWWLKRHLLIVRFSLQLRRKSTFWSVHYIPLALATKCSAHDSCHSSTSSVCAWCLDKSLSAIFGWVMRWHRSVILNQILGPIVNVLSSFGMLSLVNSSKQF